MLSSRLQANLAERCCLNSNGTAPLGLRQIGIEALGDHPAKSFFAFRNHENAHLDAETMLILGCNVPCRPYRRLSLIWIK